MAKAMMDAVVSWDVQKNVKALSFDTTASNTAERVAHVCCSKAI